MLSERISEIKESATLAINAKAKELIKNGKDIVLFGAGEPDFDTPENIKEAAKKAIDDGFTKYTPASGIEELKDAICKKLKKDNNLDYKNENIIISNGGKQVLSNAIRALCNEGDEVIIFSPYWVSYAEQVKIAGAKPVFVDCYEKNNFELRGDDLKRFIDNTKLIILNSPCNPTGAVFPKILLERIADLAVESNIYVISDEVYEAFVYEGKHFSIASLNEEIKKLTVTVNACSKSYSMTGWRVGYGAASSEIIKAMSNLQSQETSNPCSIAQKAAVEALTGQQDSVKEMVEAFRERRNLMVKRLNEIDKIKCITPKGAFYAFPNISGLFNERIKNSTDFANELLNKAGVAVVPGIEFGSDSHIRLSYATSMANIDKGIDRIEEFCKSL